MPLSKCRVCGQDVASEATTCPHCGAPYPTGKGTNWALAGVALIAILLVGWFLTGNF